MTPLFYRHAIPSSRLSLRSLPLSSCRLSCCVASPIAPAGCCILASLVVPLTLLSCLLSHRVSIVTPPPLSSHLPSSMMPHAATNARYLPDTANDVGKPRALVCVPTHPLHCALTIHQGTSCPSHFCDLCLCTSRVDIM